MDRRRDKGEAFPRGEGEPSRTRVREGREEPNRKGRRRRRERRRYRQLSVLSEFENVHGRRMETHQRECLDSPRSRTM